MKCKKCKNLMSITGNVSAEAGHPLKILCTADTYRCYVCAHEDVEAEFSIGDWVLQ